MSSAKRQIIFAGLILALVLGQFAGLSHSVVATTTNTVSYHLHADSSMGNPLVVPPSSWVTGKTASDLADFIPNCASVAYWNGSSWITYTSGSSQNDFVLESGIGYKVVVPSDTLIYFEGTESDSTVVNMPRTNQDIDQYHFTVPSAWVGRTAEDLITHIDKANDIFYYNVAEEGTIGHVQGLPFNNFTLDANTSYIVQITADTAFDPIIEDSQKPDLIVKDIYYQDQIFKIKYCNQGQGTSDDKFYISLSAVDKTFDPSQQQNSFISFPVPATGECVYTTDYKVGFLNLTNISITADVTVLIDSGQNIDESDETNNSYTERVALGTEKSCTDTDNGQDYYEQGTITYCTSKGCATHTDYCSKNSEVLTEKYCENGIAKAEQYTCAYGCSNGACISSEENNYYLQYTREDETTAEYYAYCDDSTDCVSSSEVCYNSGQEPWSNDRYVCYSDDKENGKWYKCQYEEHLGKAVSGYACVGVGTSVGWKPIGSSYIKPENQYSCTDGYDNDADGKIDSEDKDCIDYKKARTTNPKDSSLVPITTPRPENPELVNRLKGRILLAAENKGRIYYIPPTESKRYEVTFGNIISLFKKLALGIKSEELDQIPIALDSVTDDQDRDNDGYSDWGEVKYGYNPDVASSPAQRGNDKFKFNHDLANRLKGRLLLDVNRNGRIWFVDQDGERWEVTFANIMTLFQKLSLGISNTDLDQIEEAEE